MDSRESVLKALLSFTRPIPDVARQLSAYGWDVPSPLVVLDAIHISATLNRFMAGDLSSVQVEDWANCIECRDDIEYDPSSAVGLALHELANPVLHALLQSSLQRRWLQLFRSCNLTRHSSGRLRRRLIPALDGGAK